MGIFAVSIVKSALFQGKTEKWSNVYHYSLATNLDATLATDLVDQLAAAEKTFHANTVTFEDGRVWSVGGTPSQNETIVIRDLSGVGSLAVSNGFYREACLVARIDTNRNTNTGKRIYLRKYYHVCGCATITADQMAGKDVLTGTQTNPVKTGVETIREITLSPGSILVTLCAPGGQQVSDSRPVSVLDFPHTRQFRR